MSSISFLQIVAITVCLQAALAFRLPYIFNGKDVDYAGKYPWQVSLQKPSGFHFCGGSIIAENWILTARHCTAQKSTGYTVSKDISQIKVVVGLHDKKKTKGQPKSYDVAEVINHPRCRAGAKLSCDISLLRLATPIGCNRYVKKVQLPDPDEDFVGADCVVSGWGRMTNKSSDRPKIKVNVLQEMPVNVWSATKCQRYWRGYTSAVCVMNKAGPLGGVRPGDSGGPLSCKKNGVWKVAGAASFIGGNPKYPNAYAAAAPAAMRDWIKQQTGL